MNCVYLINVSLLFSFFNVCVSMYMHSFRLWLCVSVLVQLLVELQSEVSFRFVLDEIHKQVRETLLFIYTCRHRNTLNLLKCVSSSIIFSGLFSKQAMLLSPSCWCFVMSGVGSSGKDSFSNRCCWWKIVKLCTLIQRYITRWRCWQVSFTVLEWSLIRIRKKTYLTFEHF